MELLAQLDALSREEAGPYAAPALLQYGLQTQQAISAWIASVNTPILPAALTKATFPLRMVAYLQSKDEAAIQAEMLANLKREAQALLTEIKVWGRQNLLLIEQGEQLYTRLEYLIMSAKLNHQHPLWRQQPALFQSWCARLQMLEDLLRLVRLKLDDLRRLNMSLGLLLPPRAR